jgi:hypothetical protein
VSVRALQLAARALNPERHENRLRLFQSALIYRDDRLAGLDAAVLIEVIEHTDPERLPALERTVFGFAAPAIVVVTTPNAEYNPLSCSTPNSCRGTPRPPSSSATSTPPSARPPWPRCRPRSRP